MELCIRERKICTRRPPVPDPLSGLALSTSRFVPEGDHAVYECMKTDQHVPGTEDGKFRVPCKRSGQFEQSMRTDWPTCEVRPTRACTPMPDPGPGYELVGPQLLYVAEGHVVEYQCDKSGYLAGDAKTASYKCVKNADGNAYDFQPLSFTGENISRNVKEKTCVDNF